MTTQAMAIERATSLQFEIGPVLFSLADGGDAVGARLRGQMDPLQPVPRTQRAPDVVVQMKRETSRPVFVDVQNPAQDGIVTASDGRALYLLSGDQWCAVPVVWTPGTSVVECSADFPMGVLVGRVLRPALQLSMPKHNGCAVHASAVAFDDRGIVVAGWSESGKTETALALAEAGARFVSDKWTPVTAERRISAFPITVGVRRWVLPYVPRLRRALPRAARAQLAVAGVVGSMVRPLHRLGALGGVGALAWEAASRAMALADRASVRPSELQRIYGGESWGPSAALEVLVLLQTGTTKDVVVDRVEPAFAARRLAGTGSFERRGFFDLHERARYALVGMDADPRREIEAREERLLVDILSEVEILNVIAPFPGDPRRVADAIQNHI